MRLVQVYEKINASIDTFFVTWGYGVRRLCAASPWGERGAVFFLTVAGMLMTLVAECFPPSWVTRTILAMGMFLVLNGFVAVMVPLTHPYPKPRPKKRRGK